MKRLHQLWVILLTTVLLMGMGLQGLPVPCQNGQCGTGGCATSLTPCPASCTCHFADTGADACCHPGDPATVADAGDHHHPAPASGHAALTAADSGHGADPVPQPDAHAGHAELTSHDGHQTAQAMAVTDPPHSHCAPGQGDTSWPHLSLPKIRLAALLPAAPVLDSPDVHTTCTRTRERPQSPDLPPHLRPPDA